MIKNFFGGICVVIGITMGLQNFNDILNKDVVNSNWVYFMSMD